MKQPNLLRIALLTLLVSMLGLGKSTAKDPYATFFKDTLTFYYDSKAHTGTKYYVRDTLGYPDWYVIAKKVKTVVFDDSFRSFCPNSTTYWFRDMSYLTSIIGMAENLNTSSVVDMSYMFDGCYQLKNLDMSNFDTRWVRRMFSMFYGCEKLEILDLSSFNTRLVYGMNYMFKKCSALKTIYVSEKWSTTKVTDVKEMFLGCTSLVGGAGTKYDTSHVDSDYAHIDGGAGNPGYLSSIPSYALYEGGTLYFLHDNYRSLCTGMTYDLDGSGWLSVSQNIERVVFDKSFRFAYPTSTNGWFAACFNLWSIMGLEYLNTEDVTDMASMFNGCAMLKELDLSNFNTSNVTSMKSMFANCFILQTLDLSSFNTDKVTDMSGMFLSCEELSVLDLCSFKTFSVKDMEKMFDHCGKLQKIYVGNNWSTTLATKSMDMFRDCFCLLGSQGTTFDSNFTDKLYARIDNGEEMPGYLSSQPYVTYEDGTLTFYGDNLRSSRSGRIYNLNRGDDAPGWYVSEACQEVTTVVFDTSFVYVRPTTTNRWFYSMPKLKTLTGLENLNTSEVRDMAAMFSNSYALTSLDLSYFDTGKVTDMRYMFYSCNSLKSIFVGNNWNVNANVKSTDMFWGCSSLVGGSGTKYSSSHLDASYARVDGGTDAPGYLTWKGPYVVYNSTTLTFYCDEFRATRQGTTYDLNEGNNQPEWDAYNIAKTVSKVVFDISFKAARPTTTAYWFNNMKYLKEISYINYYLNTSEVTNMTCMFMDCCLLTYLNIYSLDMQKVENLTQMFSGCSSLTQLYVNGSNLKNAVTMSGMFEGCSGLSHLDVTEFYTRKVKDMNSMFSGCNNIKQLDLSSFYTGNVYDFSNMFADCSSLTFLDLRSFSLERAEALEGMFMDCNALTTIYVGNEWDTSNVQSSDDMFYGCTNLVGYAGTTYDPDHTDAAYAHIDGGTDNPGYLSGIEPYVAYDNGTLTFYNDLYRDSRPGKTYLLNTSLTPEWYGDGNYKNVSNVVFDPSFAYVRPTSTSGWFLEMSKLRSITGMKEYLNTSDVENMFGMFFGCSLLEGIELSNFDTQKVTMTNSMFNGCSNLKTLDLSSFNMDKVTDMGYMFSGCSNLKTIFVDESWNTEDVSTSHQMFNGCTSLVGGAGTKFDAEHTDGAYAHIDGGTDNPGYLSLKTNLKGDVNLDGQVGIGDIVATTNVMAGVEANPDIVARADVNGDNQVGIGDIVAITNIMAGTE